MDNYTKGEIREVEELPVFDLKEGTICMRVSSGSKMRNLMGFAVTKMKQPTTREMCWNGTGSAVTKTMSCVDIMRRKFKDLHQITKHRYRRIEEYWEPKVEGLERLKVNRDTPAISILLSKDPLDKTDPGYQPPVSSENTRKDIVRNGQPRKPRIPEQRDKNKHQSENDRKKNTENKHGEQPRKPGRITAQRDKANHQAENDRKKNSDNKHGDQANRSEKNRKRGQGSWRGQCHGNTDSNQTEKMETS